MSRIFDGKQYRDMTPEEEAEHARLQEEMEKIPAPTDLEARVAQLEAEQADMIAAYEEGVNNG